MGSGAGRSRPGDRESASRSRNTAIPHDAPCTRVIHRSNSERKRPLARRTGRQTLPTSLRALDEPVARRFVRARLPPSPTENPSAQTKPGRLSTRTFVVSSQTPSPAPSSAPNRLPDDPLPSPSLCLPSDLGFSPTHPHPEPPSFLASAPSTLRLLSPHLLSPPNRTGTAPGPPIFRPLLVPSDRPPNARPPPHAPCPAALLPLVRSVPRFSLHAPFTPLRLFTPVHFHEMMSGCSKSAAAHPLRVRERELDFRFEGYAGTMNRKGQGTSLAGADDRPKRSVFRAIPGGVDEGHPRVRTCVSRNVSFPGKRNFRNLAKIGNFLGAPR